jgi:bifunctional non-homologous end joining protein LigD
LEKSHNARFIKPMECLPVEKIPEGDNWTYELKLDGYRLQAVKASGKVILYSRRGIDLTKRYRPYLREPRGEIPRGNSPGSKPPAAYEICWTPR